MFAVLGNFSFKVACDVLVAELLKKWQAIS